MPRHVMHYCELDEPLQQSLRHMNRSIVHVGRCRCALIFLPPQCTLWTDLNRTEYMKGEWRMGIYVGHETNNESAFAQCQVSLH
jgi:hypothetical protein